MTSPDLGPARLVPPELPLLSRVRPTRCECGKLERCQAPPFGRRDDWSRFWAAHPYRALAGQSWHSRRADRR